MDHDSGQPASLDDILSTEALSKRAPHPPDFQAEIEAFHALARQMANQPDGLLDALMRTALRLCGAGSAGVSLLEPTPDGNEVFRWVSLAGAFEPYKGGSTPRDFSPCGTCLDRNAPQLYTYPNRRFNYLSKVPLPIVEALVIPFGVERPILGTIWIVAHNDERKFDSPEALKTQIFKDVTRAKAYFRRTAGL